MDRVINKISPNTLVKFGDSNLIKNQGILKAKANFRQWAFSCPQSKFGEFINRCLCEYQKKYTTRTFQNIKLILNSMRTGQGGVWTQDFLTCQSKQGLIQIFDIQYKRKFGKIVMIVEQITIDYTLAPDYIILYHYVRSQNWFSSSSRSFTTIHQVPKTLTVNDIKCLKNLCSFSIFKREDIINMIKQEDQQSHDD